MKILPVLFIIGICFLNRLCFAQESTTKISPRVMLNLSLLPQETNLPTLDGGKSTDGPRPGIEVVIQTLSGGRSISDDTTTPLFIRVNQHGVSIRFEKSFK